MRKDKIDRRPDDNDEETPAQGTSGQDRREKLDEDTESALEDIDAVLEENAESFVRSYVQKGGQ
ncbi:ubiquitin-like protein Pup [Saccharopolyspora rectivirgula]|jgi:ubiquitin-like protein Pup|uniref:Prokaryotic ubiquitin-like protein Pup n=1 Tax=Saccharopolyspora rectivirgula TaxID=28042 RepID=A0A073B3G7_9PSEU|nr:ubiquitin-like protein Pup [Saccharopolyspora rectivirgula]KEI45812.1 ubiquitin [Saccharopolyspora rectivirgula]